MEKALDGEVLDRRVRINSLPSLHLSLSSVSSVSVLCQSSPSVKAEDDPMLQRNRRLAFALGVGPTTGRRDTYTGSR
jgi:hypothetical protein